MPLSRVVSCFALGAILTAVVAAVGTGCVRERGGVGSGAGGASGGGVVLGQGSATKAAATMESTPATAAARHVNRILTFGGGPTPDSSQASLEQNVLYLRRVLGLLGLSGVRQEVYFNDGSTTVPTVQYRVKLTSEQTSLEKVMDLLGQDGSAIELNFRPTQITGLAGPSTPGAIGGWFDAAARTMVEKDRLLVYFTGHGAPLPVRSGRGRGGRGGGGTAGATGTMLETWNNTSMTTRDIVTQLDKLHPEVDVTLVMVQCYSGGFANVIYDGGNPAQGLTKAHRCGFFSTIATRLAAGCTPDVDVDDYEEFSTSFFAALCGQTRGGKAAVKPDFDHDGVTSFAKAFTQVLLTSNTIDIPMTTSDQLLRDKSRFGRNDEAGLLGTDVAYRVVLEAAGPCDRAALEGLSAQLGLGRADRLAEARVMATDLDRTRRDLAQTLRDSTVALDSAGASIRRMVIQRWPELGARRPDVAGVLARDGGKLMEAITQDASYKNWDAAQSRVDATLAKDLELERKWAKVERFINRAETAILAVNLEKTATPEIVQGYREIVARENQTLMAWK